MDLIEKIRQKAQENCQKIVLPEGDEERTILAADTVIREKLAGVTIIGNPDMVMKQAEKYGLKNIEKATIVDPVNHEKKDAYIQLLVELRKHKGMNEEKAARLVEDPLYLATLMIK